MLRGFFENLKGVTFLIANKASMVLRSNKWYFWIHSVKEVYILLELKANGRQGDFSKLEMGLVLNCLRSVNGSMAKEMVVFYSARPIGLFTAQIES